MAVGSADDNITLQPGVRDLAGHVSVRASHNHPEKTYITTISVPTALGLQLSSYYTISSSDQPPLLGQIKIKSSEYISIPIS